AGWYRFGAAPTDAEGSTVIAAHVDSLRTGVGPFARLLDAEVGQEVTVTVQPSSPGDGASGEPQVLTYTVTEVVRHPKAEVPLEELFDRGGSPRLVLVTCGGRFQHEVGSYSDNVVVVAVPR